MPGKAEILCLNCFEKKIANALLKWFPISTNIQQPGLPGSVLLKQATKSQWYVPLVFLTLAVSCRGRCYCIESDCLHIAQHKWGPFRVYKEPSTACPLAGSWGYTRALVAITKSELNPSCLAGSFPEQSAECGVCFGRHCSCCLPGSKWPCPQRDSQRCAGCEGKFRDGILTSGLLCISQSQWPHKQQIRLAPGSQGPSHWDMLEEHSR